MKMKFVAATVLSLASLSAMAIPASTDDLIKGLVSSGKLATALENEKNIGEVKITRVANYHSDSGIMMLCGRDATSRSGSVLEVEVIYQHGPGTVATVYSSTTLFVTRGAPEGLKLCSGLN